MAPKIDTTATSATDAATASPAGDTPALPGAADVAKALNAQKVKVRDTRKEGKATVPIERAVKPEDVLAVAERGGVLRATLVDGRKHEVKL